MGQELFYAHFSFAKRSIGIFRTLADAVITSNSQLKKQALWCEIFQLIENLRKSMPFFQSIGQKCEVDILILFYTTLVQRLDSS